MITPDDQPDFDDDVNDTENPQDGTAETAGTTPVEPATAGGGSADNEGIDRASRAAEGSYTLEPEKGISPEPDTDNGDYNIKQ